MVSCDTSHAQPQLFWVAQNARYPATKRASAASVTTCSAREWPFSTSSSAMKITKTRYMDGKSIPIHLRRLASRSTIRGPGLSTT